MTDPKQLHALADEELTPLEASALRETLKADPQAAAEYSAILNLKDIVANNSLKHSDEEVWKGCVRRLDAIDKSRRVEGFVGRYAWALCGTMFLFILSGRYAMRNVEGDAARTQDLARMFGTSRPVDGQKLAETKMYSSLVEAVRTSLDRDEIEVGQGRFGSVRDFPAARYPLRDRRGDLMLTQIQGTLSLEDTAPLSSNPGMEASVLDRANCVVWHKNNQTWILSGDRPLEQLSQVAERLAEAR